MMWIGRMGALVTKLHATVNAFCWLYRGSRPPRTSPRGRRAGLSGASRLVRISELGRSLVHHRTAHDEFDIAAANADIVQLAIGEQGQFTHSLAISAPSGKLLRNRLERDHSYSFSSRRSAYRAAT